MSLSSSLHRGFSSLRSSSTLQLHQHQHQHQHQLQLQQHRLTFNHSNSINKHHRQQQQQQQQSQELVSSSRVQLLNANNGCSNGSYSVVVKTPRTLLKEKISFLQQQRRQQGQFSLKEEAATKSSTPIYPSLQLPLHSYFTKSGGSWSHYPFITSAAASSSGLFPYPSMHGDNLVRATTILCVRKGNQAVMVGDGQVSFGDMVVKPNARKIRRISNGRVVVGCAGSVADAFTLIDRLESKLDECGGKLQRACIELAKAWRTDKYLRHLQASLIAVDKEVMLNIGGAGDIMESHDNVLSTGSGMSFALPAARALLENCPDMDAEQIALKAMKLAADMCVYTNHNFIIEKIDMLPDSRVTIDEVEANKAKEGRAKPAENKDKEKDTDSDDD